MRESHGDHLMLLVGLIGLLFLIIMGVLIVSTLRKKGPGPVLQDSASGAGSGAAKDPELALAPQKVLAGEPESTSASAAMVTESQPKKEESKSIGAEAQATEVRVDLRKALAKTEENLFGRIRNLFKGELAKEHIEDIEEILYTSDLGPKTVQSLMDSIQSELSRREKGDYQVIREALKNKISEIFAHVHAGNSAPQILERFQWASQGPTVLMVVGVNGAGKTTSIGKISAQLAQSGKKVLVAAGDTFRAAAGGQLKVWTERAQVEIFSPEGVTDPSAVAYEAVNKAKAQGYDVVVIDTAGRLHTQSNLMEELKKMKRVMTKVIPEAPHEILIILDANSGQNALIQAKEFHQALGLTGAILTKMDGTAKGGVAVGLTFELGIPIKFIGVGERIQDLRVFDYKEFVDSII